MLVTFSKKFLKKVLPDLGKVMKAMRGTFSVASRKCECPSKIHFEELSSRPPTGDLRSEIRSENLTLFASAGG